MRSAFFAASFLRAFSATRSVSAAKPTIRRSPLFFATLGQNVRRRFERKRQRFLVALDLLVEALHGTIVGHGGGENRDRRFEKSSRYGPMHLFGGAHVDALDARRRVERRRPADQESRCAPRRAAASATA